jgi:hypothetical protein
MKEAEWLACGDPERMINHLPGRRGYARKLLLLGCACCRLVWDQMPDERCREAVRTAEQFADGEVDEVQFTQATAAAGRAVTELQESGTADEVSLNIAFAAAGLQHLLDRGGYRAAGYVERRTNYVDPLDPDRAVYREQHVALILDIFAVLYLTPDHEIAPEWLTTDVVALAEGIYEEWAFDRMPILADALQDAGCDSEEVLKHCRDTALTHVRGCWVLDTILWDA